MNLFGVLEISSSALLAERQRAEVVASNLANAETTRTPDGGPYRRQHVVFNAVRPSAFARTLQGATDWYGQGVRVEEVVDDPAPPVRRFEPGHPDADAQGYVSYPAINPIEEMVNLMGATRAYQLNAAAIQATKSMIVQSLEILR
ncbi:MAG: flagellar basal body rod protein FlgC [Acidobacteria bacterium]|nr:flagellar basal body rod protein FlgC [Acidobacteriota bacterium]MBI3663015.1 flagellar basal body rod protein FlgC [Acidobacteriota bacterium]